MRLKIRLGNLFPEDILFDGLEFRYSAPGGARVMGYFWLPDVIKVEKSSGAWIGKGFYNYLYNKPDRYDLYKLKIREILQNSDK